MKTIQISDKAWKELTTMKLVNVTPEKNKALTLGDIVDMLIEEHFKGVEDISMKIRKKKLEA